MAEFTTHDNFITKLDGGDILGAFENVLLNLQLCEVKFDNLIDECPDEVSPDEIKTMMSNLNNVRKEVKTAERNYKRKYNLKEIPPFASFARYFGPSGAEFQPKQLGVSSVGDCDVVIRDMFVPVYDKVFKDYLSAKQLYRSLTNDKIIAFLRFNNRKMEERD